MNVMAGRCSANNAGLPHKAAQKAFVKRTAYNGKVGIWHEAYTVGARPFEAL